MEDVDLAERLRKLAGRLGMELDRCCDESIREGSAQNYGEALGLADHTGKLRTTFENPLL
jgi:hypothetical protein